MADLDKFTRAYIVAALWSSTDDDGEPLDTNYRANDISPDTLAAMAADCAKFQTDHADDIAAGPDGGDFDRWERAGHDFWLTRSRHGCGFWDGDWPEPQATRLTDAAHKCGERDLYVGDDGKLHI